MGHESFHNKGKSQDSGFLLRGCATAAARFDGARRIRARLKPAKAVPQPVRSTSLILHSAGAGVETPPLQSAKKNCFWGNLFGTAEARLKPCPDTLMSTLT
jgi:hypothetical protein